MLDKRDLGVEDKALRPAKPPMLLCPKCKSTIQPGLRLPGTIEMDCPSCGTAMVTVDDPTPKG